MHVDHVYTTPVSKQTGKKLRREESASPEGGEVAGRGVYPFSPE